MVATDECEKGRRGVMGSRSSVVDVEQCGTWTTAASDAASWRWMLHNSCAAAWLVGRATKVSWNGVTIATRSAMRLGEIDEALGDAQEKKESGKR